MSASMDSLFEKWKNRFHETRRESLCDHIASQPYEQGRAGAQFQEKHFSGHIRQDLRSILSIPSPSRRSLRESGKIPISGAAKLQVISLLKN